MVENLARKLATKISTAQGLDAEKEAVIAYGLIAIFQIILTTFLVILFGALAGVLAESLIICFSVSILRKYSGGAHAGTLELCTGFSVFYCVSTAAISKWLLAGIYHRVAMSISIVVIFAWSFWMIYRVAPVDSPSKPIRSEQKKKRMKKGCYWVLSVYLLLSFVCFILSDRFVSFKSIGISLLFGVVWQIFTLTRPGEKFIHKMNNMILRKEKKQ